MRRSWSSSWPAAVLLLALGASMPLTPSTGAAAVVVDFTLETGSASSSPFDFTLPGTETSVTVTPSLELEDGALVARFDTAAAVDSIEDGPMVVDSLASGGTLALTIRDTIQIGPFPVDVEAVIGGPVTVTQTAPAIGRLVDGTTFVETSPGAYEVAIGPLTCSDSAFGLVCNAVATALGLEFPLDRIVTPNAALPVVVGSIENLDAPGEASIGSDLEIEVPLGPATGTGVTFRAEFVWMEEAREFIPIPEPGVPVLAGLALALHLVAGRRRRVVG